MKKVLPLCLKPYITSECWTYYKFAILQTEETHIDWLMNYMDLWTDVEGNSMYGNMNERFQMSSFSDILDIKDGYIMNQSKETIINYLIECINKNQYIILDVDYNKLFNAERRFYLHEVLIYGYDEDRKCFYCPILEGQIFKENTIDFSKIVEAFSSILDYYRSNPEALWQRRERFYGITLLRPTSFIPKNNFCYDFINKIRDEAIGYFYIRGTVNENLTSEGEYICYSGNTVLLLIRKFMNESHKDELFMNYSKSKIKMTCLKTLEHQNILLISMRHFAKVFDAQNELFDVLNNYESCCNEMRIIYMMYEKFLITNDSRILSRISEYLYALYYNRWRILNEFTTQAKDIYMNKCLLGPEYKDIN